MRDTFVQAFYSQLQATDSIIRADRKLFNQYCQCNFDSTPQHLLFGRKNKLMKTESVSYMQMFTLFNAVCLSDSSSLLTKYLLYPLISKQFHSDSSLDQFGGINKVFFN